jgi:hypothetical protein
VAKYERVIQDEYPGLELVLGTHKPLDEKEFRRGVKELLCPTIQRPQDMNDITRGALQVPGKPLSF